MSGMLIGLAAMLGIDQAAKAIIEKKFKLQGSKSENIFNKIFSIKDGSDYKSGKWLKNKPDKEIIEDTEDKLLYKDILDGRIRLRRLHNSGIACSKLSHYSEQIKYVSMGATFAVLVHFIVYMFHREPNAYKWAFTFILSGALSNTIDRIRYGYVVDYFSINHDAKTTKNLNYKGSEIDKPKQRKTLVYNLGDMFIFVGAIIAIIAMLFKSGK